MRGFHVALLALVPSALTAQSDPVANIMYPERQRVRVVAPALLSKPLIARVAGVDSQALTLSVTQRGSTVRVPLRDITTLSASGGTDRGKGVRRGALVGLALGAWLFADTYPEVKEDDYWGIAGLALGLVAFGITPGIGALGGYFLAPERWDPLATPPARSAAAATMRIRLVPDEVVRVTTRQGKHSGRVQTDTNDLVTITTKRDAVPLRWNEITSISVSGEPSRLRGAARGAIIAVAITAIGVATDPLPTAAENAGVVVGNAGFGGIIGAFFPMRGWTRLPVVRPDQKR